MLGLRPFAAALGGVIVLTAVGMFSLLPRCGFDCDAKFCVARPAECVFVLNTTKHIETPLSTACNIIQLDLSEWASGACLKSPSLFRIDNRLGGSARVRWTDKDAVGWMRPWSQGNPTVANQIIGGRLTDVCGAQEDFCRNDKAEIKLFNVHFHVGAQLSLSSSGHQPPSRNQRDELQKRNEARDSSDLVANSPTLWRLILALGSGGLGFVVCLFGVSRWEGGQWRLDAVLLCLSLAMATYRIGLIAWSLPVVQWWRV